MKIQKNARLLLCLALILVLAGCGGSTSGETGSQPIVESSSSVQAEIETESSSSAQAKTETESSEDGIDVDLTVLSSTMVYSEVYNIMVSPDEYIGKTVKMDGLFSYFHDETTNNEYFACIIQDATACCAQGIEFVLAGDYKYPEDYPELNSEICVVGVFDTYEEDGSIYCTLRDARLV